MILFSLLIGCAYDEELNDFDFFGTVKIPAAATKFKYGLGDDEVEIDDIRGLGPLYIGVFPSVEDDLYPFPHPEMGPILAEGQDGNTYPYGGNSIGRFDWGCYEQLICKMVTGRFESFADIIDFHANVLGEPIRTPDGQPVQSEAEYRERCFEITYTTSDSEMLFIGERDFTLDGDYLVAEDVVLPQVAFREGMQVWAWVDMPSASFEFNTCTAGVGETQNYYNEFYQVGTNSIDVLNFPGKYIDSGDWVTQEPATINSVNDEFELEIGYNYVEE